MTTPEQLQACWRTFNARYFRNGLPPIAIEWSTRLTSSAGLFVTETGPRTGAGAKDRRIRLSLRLLANQPVSETLETLAHEMIHQWQFDLRKRRPNHGHDFLRMMAIMNRDGLRITIRHNLNDAVDALARYAWHCLRCGHIYRRQRRTIRPSLHQCGACAGPLKELARSALPAGVSEKVFPKPPD